MRINHGHRSATATGRQRSPNERNGRGKRRKGRIDSQRGGGYAETIPIVVDITLSRRRDDLRLSGRQAGHANATVSRKRHVLLGNQGRRRLDASILSNFFFFRRKSNERSFRTEAGLYYSYYYKELVQARAWTDGQCGFQLGIYSLMYDNVSEHLRTVNIIERFNIHEEIIVGTLYRLLPIQVP